MKAVILAAGRGQRLGDLAADKPKSFLEVGGTPIFEHQLRAVRAAGIEDVVAVIGYRAELFEREYGRRGIVFVRNPFYERTNVLASLWFAREHLADGFFFMHADTWFDPSILADLARDPRDLVLCVEKKATSEEEMKVAVEDGSVRRISKQMPCDEAFGEFTGLARIGPVCAPDLRDLVRERIENRGTHDDFFEAALQDLIDRRLADARIMEIGDRVSVEIDFPEDLRRARELAGRQD